MSWPDKLVINIWAISHATEVQWHVICQVTEPHYQIQFTLQQGIEHWEHILTLVPIQSVGKRALMVGSWGTITTKSILDWSKIFLHWSHRLQDIFWLVSRLIKTTRDIWTLFNILSHEFWKWNIWSVKKQRNHCTGFFNFIWKFDLDQEVTKNTNLGLVYVLINIMNKKSEM